MKKFNLVLVLALVILTIVPTAAFAGYSGDILDNNFDDGDISMFTTEATGTQTPSVEIADDTEKENNKLMKISVTGASSDATNNYIKFNLAERITQPVLIQYKIKLEKPITGSMICSLAILDNNTVSDKVSTLLNNLSFKPGQLALFDINLSGTYTDNQWYNIAYLVYPTWSQRASVAMADFSGEFIPLKNTGGTVASKRLAANIAPNSFGFLLRGGASAYIDDLKISYAEDIVAFPNSGKLTSNKPVTLLTGALRNDNTTLQDIYYTLDGSNPNNDIALSPNRVKYAAQFAIETPALIKAMIHDPNVPAVNPAPVTFTFEDSFDIIQRGIKLGNDDIDTISEIGTERQLTFYADITNYSNRTRYPLMAVGLYDDAENRLLDVYCNAQTVSLDETEKTMSITYNIPEGTDLSGKIIKAFIFEGESNIKPLCGEKILR